jgi:hypothetical protein
MALILLWLLGLPGAYHYPLPAGCWSLDLRCRASILAF